MAHQHVTQKEVEDSYEFKLIKRILKQEFPWIIDVKVPSDEEIDKYALIFVDLIIDPFILQRKEGWPFNSYMRSYFNPQFAFMMGNKDYTYQSSYLSTIYNIARDESGPIEREIESTLRSVQKSPAIPSDLKLGKDRSFAIGSYTIPKDIPVPEDVIFRA